MKKVKPFLGLLIGWIKWVAKHPNKEVVINFWARNIEVSIDGELKADRNHWHHYIIRAGGVPIGGTVDDVKKVRWNN